MTRRLSPDHITVLRMVAATRDGSFVPEANTTVDAIRLLRQLVSWGHLSSESTDTAFPRFHITAKGRVET